MQQPEVEITSVRLRVLAKRLLFSLGEERDGARQILDRARSGRVAFIDLDEHVLDGPVFVIALTLLKAAMDAFAGGDVSAAADQFRDLSDLLAAPSALRSRGQEVATSELPGRGLALPALGRAASRRP